MDVAFPFVLLLPLFLLLLVFSDCVLCVLRKKCGACASSTRRATSSPEDITECMVPTQTNTPHCHNSASPSWYLKNSSTTPERLVSCLMSLLQSLLPPSPRLYTLTPSHRKGAQLSHVLFSPATRHAYWNDRGDAPSPSPVWALRASTRRKMKFARMTIKSEPEIRRGPTSWSKLPG